MLAIDKGANVSAPLRQDPSVLYKSLILREMSLSSKISNVCKEDELDARLFNQLFSVACESIPLSKMLLHADNIFRGGEGKYSYEDKLKLIGSAHVAVQAKPPVKSTDLILLSETFKSVLNSLGHSDTASNGIELTNISKILNYLGEKMGNLLGKGIYGLFIVILYICMYILQLFGVSLAYGMKTIFIEITGFLGIYTFNNPWFWGILISILLIIFFVKYNWRTIKSGYNTGIDKTNKFKDQIIQFFTGNIFEDTIPGTPPTTPSGTKPVITSVNNSGVSSASLSPVNKESDEDSDEEFDLK
jgi:hypothetical protein